MTPDQFRKLALSLSGAAEGSHMAHPDFRVGGRIFATLGYPDARHGMIKLTPGQQADCVESDRTFSPAAGAWGRKGSTTVLLATADRGLVAVALEAAWRNVAPSALLRKSGPERPPDRPRSRPGRLAGDRISKK